MSQSKRSKQADSERPTPRERRLTAMRNAERVLRRGTGSQTIGERLTRLVESGRSAYDLDERVDIYGDGVVAALEERVADLLGKEAAAFFPTGVMAQQAALRCWAGRTGNRTVALHPLSHPEQHEEGAFQVLSGLRTVHPTTAPRMPTAEEVRAFGEPFGTLMLELPLREPGFLLPEWDELTEVVAAARERDAVVHFDGARLWESTVRLGHSLDEIAALADSVYVSFYKGLGGLGGAALAGPATLVDEARIWRRRHGGQMFQQFPTVLAALAGLDEELPKLPSYVAQARVVAEGLRDGFAQAGLPWVRIVPEVPHTQEFHVWLPYDAEVLTEAALTQAEETGTGLFWFFAGREVPGVSFTEVSVGEPALTWTRDDVRAATLDFARRLPR